MSYNTLTIQSRDADLANRVTACVTQEAWENAAVHDSEFAGSVRSSSAQASQLVWPVCVATEAEYASALAADVPDPGKDEAVISDGMILSAVQASWIQDPPA